MSGYDYIVAADCCYYDNVNCAGDEVPPFYKGASIIHISKTPDADALQPSEILSKSLPYVSTRFIDRVLREPSFNSVIGAAPMYMVSRGDIAATIGHITIPPLFSGLILDDLKARNVRDNATHSDSLQVSWVLRERYWPMSMLRNKLVGAETHGSMLASLNHFIHGAHRILEDMGVPLNIFMQHAADDLFPTALDQRKLAQRYGGFLLTREGIEVHFSKRNLIACAENYAHRTYLTLATDVTNQDRWNTLGEKAWEAYSDTSALELYGLYARRLLFGAGYLNGYMFQTDSGNLTKIAPYATLLAELLREAKTQGFASRWLLTGFHC